MPAFWDVGPVLFRPPARAVAVVDRFHRPRAIVTEVVLRVAICRNCFRVRWLSTMHAIEKKGQSETQWRGVSLTVEAALIVVVMAPHDGIHCLGLLQDRQPDCVVIAITHSLRYSSQTARSGLGLARVGEALCMAAP